MRNRWAVGLLGMTLTLVYSGPGNCAPTHSPAPLPVSAADCDHLIAQFEVAWSTHSSTKRAESAHRARDLGEAACREGRYSDGVHQLRRALHELGLKPVRRSQGSASR
jgi:hypothetical protein